MKRPLMISASLVVLAMCGMASPAYADSAEANCQVRKDGETKHGMSGPCTFSQRQGYIDLDLRNGETFSLSPTGQPNHFKDQKGNKVVRTQAGRPNSGGGLRSWSRSIVRGIVHPEHSNADATPRTRTLRTMGRSIIRAPAREHRGRSPPWRRCSGVATVPALSSSPSTPTSTAAWPPCRRSPSARTSTSPTR